MGIYEAIRASRPIGYWPLQELSGTVARDVVGGRDGTYVNTPTLGQVGPLGVGKMVRFNGSDEYVSIADDNLWSAGTTSSLSLEIVVLLDATLGAGAVVSKGGTSSYEWEIRGGYTLYQQAGAAHVSIGFRQPVRGFTLYHLAFSVTLAERLSGYVNGDLITTTTFSGSYTNGTNLIRLAARDDGLHFQAGRMAHFAIYDRYISGAEWRAHHRALLGPLNRRGRFAA